MSSETVTSREWFPSTHQGFRAAYRSLRMEERNANRRIETYRRCMIFKNTSDEVTFLSGTGRHVGEQTESRCSPKMFYAVIHAIGCHNNTSLDPLSGAAHRRLADRRHRAYVANLLEGQRLFRLQQSVVE